MKTHVSPLFDRRTGFLKIEKAPSLGRVWIPYQKLILYDELPEISDYYENAENSSLLNGLCDDVLSI